MRMQICLDVSPSLAVKHSIFFSKQEQVCIDPQTFDVYYIVVVIHSQEERARGGEESPGTTAEEPQRLTAPRGGGA